MSNEHSAGGDSAAAAIGPVGRLAITIGMVCRAAGLLRRPWVLGAVLGFAAGLLLAPVPGRVLRHKVIGMVRAGASRPVDPDEPTSR